MRTFLSPAHQLHDPGVLPQPEGGSHNYYSEVAQRATLVQDALIAGGFAPPEVPADHGASALAAVHSAELLQLLEHAYERMVREVHGGAHFPRVVLPETFAVRHIAERAPQSVWAHLGYFCYDTSSPIFRDTWQAVYWAAQSALSAAEAVAGGEQAAYALCRPPGHHASRALFGGFCYVNNAAVAANWLCGQGSRVAIVDVDYHHGNGTQEIFYQRRDVLTVSLHVDPDVDYPYFWGHADERGSGEGEENNLNLPLPRGTGEAEYLAALDDGLATVRAFAPDVVVVSLGVDTYRGDPVGGFLLESTSFPLVGDRFARLRTPLVIVQEGGYALPALGENVTGFLRSAIGA